MVDLLKMSDKKSNLLAPLLKKIDLKGGVHAQLVEGAMDLDGPRYLGYEG